MKQEEKMPLLRFPKPFEQTHKIKIEKSLKRVDSDCIFWCSSCTVLEQVYAVLPDPDFSDIVFLHEKIISKRKIVVNNEKMLGCFSKMLLTPVTRTVFL